MNIEPSFDQFTQLSQQGNLIPVYTELMADFETPVSVYAKLHQDAGPAFLLESIEGGTNLNRYSIIGCQPERILEIHDDGNATVRYRSGEQESFKYAGDPLSVLQTAMSGIRPVQVPGMPRFIGGAVGFLGYEFVNFVEPTVQRASREVVGTPVAHFMITDSVVVFDRASQTLRLIHNANLDRFADAREAYAAASRELERLAAILGEGRAVPTIPVLLNREPPVLPSGNFERARFEAVVEQCKEYIRAGDVIQVVISQRFEKDFTEQPLDLYRALRVVNPSPYMVLYDPGPFSLVGASPEVHVRLTNGLAELRPIAGTRPRGRTIEEDLANEKDLLADDKERAEHLMLVDLARNDIGRVCQFGSVHVPEYMVIERYSHVMHIVSQVQGQLDPRHNAYDLMRATFPAGTVSGAPKVRAMQIIAEQEEEQRGPYAGAVCYFSYDGNLDSCIAIRTALVKDGRIYIQSGAGIVADSQPDLEYEETVNKARGMLKAVEMARKVSKTWE